MTYIGIIIVLGGGVLLIAAIVGAVRAARQQSETQNNMSLKKAYLYLVSVISLVIAVVGAIILLNMVLKTWVFTKADQDYYSYGPCVSSRAVMPGESMPQCTAEEEAKQKQQEDERRTAQKQRDAAQALAMILVASPVWWYHWTQARKEA